MAKRNNKIMINDSDKNQITTATQTFFADKIIGMSCSVGVSKITLGNEVSPGNYMPTLDLAMPTISLIEGLRGIQKSLNENKEVTLELVKQLDDLKEQLLRGF